MLGKPSCIGSRDWGKSSPACLSFCMHVRIRFKARELLTVLEGLCFKTTLGDLIDRVCASLFAESIPRM